MSPSEIRTRRLNRCAGNSPASIKRRTVRDDVFRISAVSSIVRSRVRGRLGAAAVEVGEGALEAERRGGLEDRRFIFPLLHPPQRRLRFRAHAAIPGATGE